MSANSLYIGRRSFLKTAGPLALGLPALVRSQTFIEKGRWSDEQLPLAREQLLKMVNAERASFGLSQLKLDDLASQVATEHARDMANGGFISHWGSDGRTPFHRYCLAGGMDALQENCSAAEDIESLSPLRVLNDLRDMHQLMLDEKPPDDGHRKTILDPFHTHVGFGVALRNRSLRLDELYLARYIQLEPFANQVRPESTVMLKGRLLDPRHFLNGVDISYEPLPAPPGIEWLRTLRPVSLPPVDRRLRPKALPGTTYTDGGKGDFDWDRNGNFRLQLKLAKTEPGIYTLLFWVRRVAADKGFPGAQVCIVSKHP